MSETEHNKSISHSHVLSPEMRTSEKAWAVAHKLLHKAAMRLRSGGLWAGSIGLAIGFAVPRGRKSARQPFRRPHPRLAQRTAPQRVPGQPDPHRRLEPPVGQPSRRRRVRSALLRRSSTQRPGSRPAPLAELVRFPRQRQEPHPPARRHGRAQSSNTAPPPSPQPQCSQPSKPPPQESPSTPSPTCSERSKQSSAQGVLLAGAPPFFVLPPKLTTGRPIHPAFSEVCESTNPNRLSRREPRS